MWVAVRRVLLWAIPAALVAVLVWTMLPHSGTAPRAASPAPTPPIDAPAAVGGGAPPPTSPPPQSPYAQIREGDLVGTDEAGQPRWRVVADAVTVQQNKQVVLLKRVRATFYQASGTITVTGDTGWYDTRTREIEITGHVHGTSTSGRQLFADRVRWASASETINGFGHIRLIEDRVVMYADRMVSNLSLGRTQFFGNVHAAER